MHLLKSDDTNRKTITAKLAITGSKNSIAISRKGFVGVSVPPHQTTIFLTEKSIADNKAKCALFVASGIRMNSMASRTAHNSKFAAASKTL